MSLRCPLFKSWLAKLRLSLSGADPGFQERGFDKIGPPKGPSRGICGYPPQKIFKFQVLGNTISAILRQSQRVLKSHFLK